MKILLKHVLRNLKDNKKRSLLIMISLMIVGVFVSFMISSVSLIANLEDVVDDELGSDYDYILENKDGTPISDTQLKELSKEFDFESLDTYTKSDGHIISDNNEYRAIVLGVDNEKAKKFNVFGSDDDNINLKENEIVILESALKNLNLSVGDKITYINSNGDKFDLTIAYAIENSNFLMYYKDQFYYFGCDIKTYNKITNNYNQNNMTLLKMNKEITSDEESSLDSLCADIGIQANIVEDDEDLDDIMELTVPVIVLVVLILSIIVYFVNNSFIKIIINERIPFMGTFRSVGANAKKVRFIMILEMIAYGVFAGVIGAAIGFYSLRLIIKLVLVPAMEELIPGVNFNFLVRAIDQDMLLIFAICIVFVAIYQVILSMSDVIKMSKISIRDAIFSKHDDIKRFDGNAAFVGLSGVVVGVLALIFSYRLNLPVSIVAIIIIIVTISKFTPYASKLIVDHIKFKHSILKLSCENVVNSKILTRSINVICILMIIIMALLSFANELKYEILPPKGYVSYDAIINVLGLDENYIVSLNSFKEVKDVSTETYFMPEASFYIGNNETSSSFSIELFTNIEALKRMNKEFQYLDSSMENIKDDEILISKSIKRKYNINQGDYIYLNSVEKEKNYTLEFPIYVKVAGYFDDNVDNIIVSKKLMADLKEYVEGSDLTYTYIDFEDNVSVKDGVDKLNKFFKEKNFNNIVKSREDYLSENENEIRGVYIGVAIICLILTIIVLVCIVNNLKICFAQRKKEFATMYSICMSKKQLKKLIRNEVIVLYLFSSLYALMYSYIIVYLMQSMIELPLKWTIGSSLIAVLVMLIVMLLVARKVGKGVNKLNIIDEIKYE